MDEESRKLILPPKYLVDQKNDMYLLYDYRNHNWIFLNKDGYEIVENLKNELPLEKVADLIFQKHHGADLEEIKNKVMLFVQYLIQVKFLFLDKYEVRQLPEPVIRENPSACSIIFEKCDYNCLYCYNRVTRLDYQSRLREMTTEEFKIALHQLIDFGVERFMFSGGEPTLRKDLIELAKFVRKEKKDSLMSLVTNGAHINDENAREFANLFNLLWVSLDSCKKEEHEALRGKDTFEKTVNGIKRLAAQGKKNVLVNSMVSNFNYQSMKETRKFVLEELGASQFRMSEFQPFKNIGHVDNKIQLNPPPPFFSIGNNETALSIAEIDRIDFGDLEKNNAYLFPNFHCGVGNGEISLHSNGNVFPCQCLTDESFKCGNILLEDIKKIFLESPIMRRMRELNVYNLEDCKKCEVKYICGGSCRASAYEIYNDISSGYKEYCTVNKRRALDKLWATKAVPFEKIKEAEQTARKNIQKG